MKLIKGKLNREDFLWSRVGEGKRNHLISCEQLYKPKLEGGLGIGKIQLINSVLLGKWLWKYPRESDALWNKVILSIYETHPNGWDANVIARWSHQPPQKAITLISQDFSCHTWFEVGDGARICFWEDLCWCKPFCSRFLNLFRVVAIKNPRFHLFLVPLFLFHGTLSFIITSPIWRQRTQKTHVLPFFMYFRDRPSLIGELGLYFFIHIRCEIIHFSLIQFANSYPLLSRKTHLAI